MNTRISSSAALVLLAAFCFGLGCSRSAEQANLETDLKARRAYFEARLRAQYELRGFASPEEAVQKLFARVAAGRIQAATDSLLGDNDFADVYWPNQKDRFKMRPGWSPQRALEWHRARRRMGLAKLEHKLKGRKFKILGLEYQPGSPVVMNALLGHIVDGVRVRIGTGKVQTIETVRVILQHRGVYRIVSLRTD